MRHIYAAPAGQNLAGLTSAVGGNSVASIVQSSMGVVVDFYDDAQTSEQTTVQSILTAAPFTFTLSSTDPTKFADRWSVLDMSNVEAWLSPRYTPYHLWQEGNAGIALTSGAVTSPVGQLDDPAPPAHVWVTGASGTRPTLNTDGAPECHLSFVLGSSSKMTCKNSTTAFQFLNTTGIGTIAARVRAGADGVAQVLLDSSGGSSSQSGLFVEKTSSNTILVLVTKGSAGNVVYSYTTTGTLLVADGWQWIIIKLTPGTNTSNISIPGKAISENFSNSTAVGGGAAPNDLAIASTSSGFSLLGTWDIRDLVIKSDVISTGDSTKMQAMPAPRSTAARSQLRLAAKNFTNFCRYLLRLDLPTTLWQDTGRSTAVTTAGQTVANVDNQVDINRRLNRDWTQATSAQRPTWRDGTGAEGLPSCQFNGSDSNTSDFHCQETPVAGGAQTFLEVIRSNHTILSGGMYAASGNWFPMSGAANTGNLVANGGPGQPYFGVHTSIGGIVRSGLSSDPTQWQIFECSRFGGDIETRASQGGTNLVSNTVPSHDFVGSTTANNANAAGGLSMADMGLGGGGAGTALGGYVALYGVWTTRLDRTTRDQILYPWIKAQYPTIPLQPGT